MRLIYTRLARLDISSIHAHIALDSPRSADDVLLRLVDACESLLDFPDRGRPGSVPATRELVIVHPHVIVYALRDSAVEVVRIFHGAQNR